MSGVSDVVLACGDCVPSHLAPEHHQLTVILLIAALTAIGCMILVWQRRHRGQPPRVTDQWGALAATGDLCPEGWQATISLQGGEASRHHADLRASPTVALEWKLYEDAGARAAIARRVSAETIGDALQMMVEDRRLDVTLEQIERSVEDRS